MEAKGKAIQVIPTRNEHREIVRAADATKRSLASFTLYAAINEARKVNRESEERK